MPRHSLSKVWNHDRQAYWEHALSWPAANHGTGRRCASETGYDLVGCFIGSEGTFACSEATLQTIGYSPAVRTLLADMSMDVNAAVRRSQR